MGVKIPLSNAGVEVSDFIIQDLGGSSKLAEMLRFGRGGIQRCFNWKRRGIPWRIIYLYPLVFEKYRDLLTAELHDPRHNKPE